MRSPPPPLPSAARAMQIDVGGRQSVTFPSRDSPLLQELSEGRSGLEAGYYRLVHPVRKRVFLRHLHIKMHHFTKTGSGQT